VKYRDFLFLTKKNIEVMENEPKSTKGWRWCISERRKEMKSRRKSGSGYIKEIEGI
jgi:hypothetical protein